MLTDRRQFLASSALAAGGSLLAPLVGKLRAEAAGVAPSKRFIFVVEGNGLPWQQVQPVGVERKMVADGGYMNANPPRIRRELTDTPLADLTLPTSLEPLNDWKNLVTIVQGMSGKMNSGGHSNDFGALGAFNAKGGVGSCGTPQAETIDFALGKKLGGVVPQIGLGISNRATDTIIYNCSASARGKALPTQCRPDLAFQAMFGSAATGDAKKSFHAQKNLLDHMVADVKRAEAEFRGQDREKLQTYLSVFEGMRSRHEKLVEMEAVLRQHLPPVTDKFTSEVETDRLDAHFDLAVSALAAGLTNVVTLASAPGNLFFDIRFHGLGISLDKHSIGHGGSFEGRKWDELSTTIRRFHFDLLARLIKKLQAIPEGDGNMFDNTLIVYLSDAAEGHHSRCWEWPMVLVGNLGGKIKAGRLLDLPGHGADDHRHIGNMYTTLLHAIGDDRELFGHRDPILARDIDQRGPISQLLA